MQLSSESFLRVLNILYTGEPSKCNSFSAVKEILVLEIQYRERELGLHTMEFYSFK